MPAKSDVDGGPELQSRLKLLSDLAGGPTAFGKLFGWSTRAVQYYLTGKTVPSRPRLARVSAALGLDVPWLPDGGGAEPSPQLLMERFAALKPVRLVASSAPVEGRWTVKQWLAIESVQAENPGLDIVRAFGRVREGDLAEILLSFIVAHVPAPNKRR